VGLCGEVDWVKPNGASRVSSSALNESGARVVTVTEVVRSVR